MGSGGRDSSEYSIGGMVPPPSHAESFESRGGAGAGRVGRLSAGVAVAPGDCAGALSFVASSLLFFKASSRSTRSLHCSSSCLMESWSALSVSDFGR